jgi:hypothetical protein
MTKTFALSSPSHPKDVRAWCEDTGTRNGGRGFSVINGAWSGVLKDGMIHFDSYDGEPMPAIVVWEGEAPAGGYNTVIPWINEQIK